jgi:hypothetical protein
VRERVCARKIDGERERERESEERERERERRVCVCNCNALFGTLNSETNLKLVGVMADFFGFFELIPFFGGRPKKVRQALIILEV